MTKPITDYLYDVLHADMMNIDQMYPQEWAVSSFRRILDDSVKDRIDLAFDDPKQFSKKPVSRSVFNSLLEHLVDPDSNLSEDQLIKLVSVFSQKCTKKEWKTIFQPILQRKKDGFRRIGWYNEIVPDGDRLLPFNTEIDVEYPEQEDGYYFGTTQHDLLGYVFIYEDNVVEVINRDLCIAIPYRTETPEAMEYQRQISKMFQPLCGLQGVSYPLVISCVMANKTNFEFIEAVELSRIKVVPTEMRRQMAEMLYSTYLSDEMFVSMADTLSSETEVDDALKHFKEVLGDTPSLWYCGHGKTFEKCYNLVPQISVASLETETQVSKSVIIKQEGN